MNPFLIHTAPLTLSTLSDHMVPVPGGRFRIGGEYPIRLSPFSIYRYLVTQALYEEVMGENPSRFQDPFRPVERVTWYDAVAFCNRLSLQQGLRPVYEIDTKTPDPNNRNKRDELKWTVKSILDADGYRLPTEAQWEYAARGGPYDLGSEYAGSHDLDRVGWYDENSFDESQPVGLKQPNALGLYDMSGNVREWCWDWYGSEYYQQFKEAPLDPQGPPSGSGRVVRGGSWFNDDFPCRVADRNYHFPFLRYVNFGFRLVLWSSPGTA